MKKAAYILLIALGFWHFSCQKQGINYDRLELPAKITIDLPESISSSNIKSAEDTINGNRIYAYMRYFIYTAEASAQFIEDVLKQLSFVSLKPGEIFSYTGQDGRIKIVELSEYQNFEKHLWRYKLTLKDEQIEVDSQNGTALEFYWNPQPKECLAIIKPATLDYNLTNKWQEGRIKLYYSQNPIKTSGYEEIMTVEISNKPLFRPRFGMRNMKMFVGRTNERVDLYGNSDLPEAWLLIPRSRPGIDWAFVASADYQNKLAVAEVGLPPNYLNTNSRNALLKTYSIYNVLRNEYYHWYLQNHGQPPDTSVMDNYLQNAKAPGFFNNNGFVQGGDEPGEEYEPLVEAIEKLKPYKPKEVLELQILFSTELSIQ